MYKNKNKLTADILGEEFKLNNNNKIYINDCLTSYNRALLEKAKILRVNNKCKYVWTRNSSILIRVKEGDKVLRIKSFEDLSNLIS